MEIRNSKATRIEKVFVCVPKFACSSREFHMKYLSCSYYECQPGGRETF